MNENIQNNLTGNNILNGGIVNSQKNEIISENNTIENTNKSFNLNPEDYPIISNYCENLTAKEYITNPAIAREEEIKKTILVLLTPDKSALLIGKPGIGKTAIVEGIAYKIQRGDVPNALKGYTILKINSSSMLGTMVVNGKPESVVNLLVSELKRASKTFKNKF